MRTIATAQEVLGTNIAERQLAPMTLRQNNTDGGDQIELPVRYPHRPRAFEDMKVDTTMFSSNQKRGPALKQLLRSGSDRRVSEHANSVETKAQTRIDLPLRRDNIMGGDQL